LLLLRTDYLSLTGFDQHLDNLNKKDVFRGFLNLNVDSAWYQQAALQAPYWKLLRHPPAVHVPPARQRASNAPTDAAGGACHQRGFTLQHAAVSP